MDIFKTGYYLLNTSMFRYSADLSPGASEFPEDLLEADTGSVVTVMVLDSDLALLHFIFQC